MVYMSAEKCNQIVLGYDQRLAGIYERLQSNERDSLQMEQLVCKSLNGTPRFWRERSRLERLLTSVAKIFATPMDKLIYTQHHVYVKGHLNFVVKEDFD